MKVVAFFLRGKETQVCGFRVNVSVGFIGRLIVYAACLEGSDPIRLFERRVNSRRGNA